MKTKNIFRMLLVAALLMGANNVKADDNYRYEGESFANLTSSSTIRVNCSVTNSNYWQITFATINDQTPDFADWKGGTDWGAAWYYTKSNHGGYLINDSYFDLKCDQSTVNKLKNNGLKISTQGLTVTSISIDGGSASGGGGGTSTTDEPAWTGNHYFGSWGGNGGSFLYLPTGTFNDLKCDGNDVIRVYGTLGNLSPDNGVTTYGIEFVTLDWTNFLKFHGTDNFANGYVDIPIIADRISLGSNGGTLLTPEQFANYLKTTSNDDKCALMNGYNFTITSIVVNPSSTSTKQDVTLSFSESTATATMGETFEAPRLTASVEGLAITYSSSNTAVATVDTSGEVTLVATGITTITASFAGNDTYNASVASYTLTVRAAAPSESDYIDVSIDGNLASHGYRTYVTTQAVDLSNSIGVEAYYATGLNSDGTKVEFTEVTGVCASGVPLLLKAKEKNASAYKLLKSTIAGTTPTGNKLKPGPASAYGSNKYVLTVHSGEVVFAEVNIYIATVDSQHAYLDLSGSNARGRLSIQLNGETTGIQSLQSDEQSLDGAIYNLRGQRVEHPTKGLYIINGKKVMIK